MKPFDLKKALAGDPVVTKEGWLVEGIHYYHNNDNLIVGIMWYEDEDGDYTYGARHWCIKGLDLSYPRKNDLFMAPKKTKLYIFVLHKEYPDYPAEGNYLTTAAYVSKDLLTKSIGKNINEGQIIEIELELP